MTAEKPTCKLLAPRKKKVDLYFLIQSSADKGISYVSIIEIVQSVVTAQEVYSLDIYVKAEEGKAYYVVNGKITGAVNLILN